MPFEAGRLRHRVRIERRVEVLDSNGDVIQDPMSGEVLYAWEPLATNPVVWAAIEPLSAREFTQSQATQSEVTARIVIRARQDLDAAVRIVHLRTVNGVTTEIVYNPRGFLEDPHTGLEYLTIPCARDVGEGQ